MKRKNRSLVRYSGPIIGVAALLSSGLYLAYARQGGLAGFPLDDAWIHQTYARNLAQAGQLAYLPGQPSAGSTSPAWSFLLSVAYMLNGGTQAMPMLWAYLVGGLALAATAWLTYRLFQQLAPTQPVAALLTGLLCAVEWHLVWAAVSGMETILFTALSLALVEYYSSFSREEPSRIAGSGLMSVRKEQTIVRAVGIGLLAGILVLTRPEGLVLAGMVLAAMAGLPSRPTRLASSALPGETAQGVPEQSPLRLRSMGAGVALATMAVLLIPYVAFNLRTSGTVWPNTFYAKHAEYQAVGAYLGAEGAHLGAPLQLIKNFWRVLSPTLVGAQLLLLPGLIYGAYRLARQRNWPAILPLVWWLALLGLYAVRLPVDYQHGRYTMPSIPWVILYGAWGTAEALHPRSRHLWLRVLSRAMPAAIAVLAVYLLGRGAIAYRDDVGFIEGEMVAVAHWLNEHTAPGDLIAVHDIGAVGYLTDRPLLDLAGLITPEVIPFITDADRLAEWMAARGAAYAVFFPDFSPTYAQLAGDPRFQQLYCSGYAWTRAAGHQNLCVYRLATAPSSARLARSCAVAPLCGILIETLLDRATTAEPSARQVNQPEQMEVN